MRMQEDLSAIHNMLWYVFHQDSAVVWQWNKTTSNWWPICPSTAWLNFNQVNCAYSTLLLVDNPLLLMITYHNYSSDNIVTICDQGTFRSHVLSVSLSGRTSLAGALDLARLHDRVKNSSPCCSTSMGFETLKIELVKRCVTTPYNSQLLTPNLRFALEATVLRWSQLVPTRWSCESQLSAPALALVQVRVATVPRNFIDRLSQVPVLELGAKKTNNSYQQCYLAGWQITTDPKADTVPEFKLTSDQEYQKPPLMQHMQHHVWANGQGLSNGSTIAAMAHKIA